MDSIRDFCDKAIMLSEGAIVKSGNVNEVADEYFKLFTEESTLEGDTKEPDRWGTHVAKIHNLKVNHNKKAKQLSVAFDIQAVEDIEALQAVYKFSNENGDIVAGSSLASLDKRITSLEINKNQKRHVKVVFDDIFPGGKTYLSLILQSKDGLTLYDVWGKAAIVVHDDQRKYYPIYPQGDVELS